VVKVYLNDDAKIPDSVKVNARLPHKGKILDLPLLHSQKRYCSILV
jgi:hypothetical protein